MTNEANFVPEKRVERLDECMFYHALDLPGVGDVPGHWDLRKRFSDYVLNVPLRGKRVLDVGTASGFITWEAERCGCAQIVSFDADSAERYQKLPFLNIPWAIDHEAWLVNANRFREGMKNSWWFAHRALGSKARRAEGDVYAIPAALGTFDVVLVGQILVHLRDGISALASIAARCADTIVIAEGMVASEDPQATLLGRANNPDQDYAFWHYSRGFYREILGMLGFEVQAIRAAGYLCNLLAPPRPVEITTIVARRVKPLAVR